MGIAAYCAYLGGGDFKNGFSKFLTQVSQGYLNVRFSGGSPTRLHPGRTPLLLSNPMQPNLGGENIPAVDANVDVLDSEDPLFKFLYKWYMDLGGIYKLAFGPKAFLVVSDPAIARSVSQSVSQSRKGRGVRSLSRAREDQAHTGKTTADPCRYILKENSFNYDKGVLAEILEPIMGKGLIPADLETWKVRRRAIVPGFHKSYLNAMVKMFGRCTEETIRKLNEAVEKDGRPVVDMETEVCVGHRPPPDPDA